jgi:hypothetical protein
MCKLTEGNPNGSSSSCNCQGTYVKSQCDVINNRDNSCKVITEYLYAGKCNNQTASPPTAAPTKPKECPYKKCHGQNPVFVTKSKGKCNSLILNKFCLKSKLIAKMNADLQCDVENKCECFGKYTLARCYPVQVRTQPSVLSPWTPYCYYFAKYTYDGMCSVVYRTQ